MNERRSLKVAIIHPWFPQYRAAFFETLLKMSHGTDIEVHIFHGDPPPEWGARGDAVVSEYAVNLHTRYFSIGTKHLGAKSLRAFNAAGPFDLVILEQAVRNLETYLIVASRSSRRIAFWGHGKTYTASSSGAQEKLKRWLTSRGRWFFAYTEGGRTAVATAGFDPRRITVVENSIDARALTRAVQEVSADEVDAFRRAHHLTTRTALFLGGLDESKRIQFLLDSASIAHDRDRDFRLVVAGNGEDRRIIERAASENPWIVYIGSVSGKEKAVALASASVLAMPGRVGLVAVDSFAAAVPIVTTDWPWHAPEFEYLEPGLNAVVTPNDVDSYAAMLLATLQDTAGLAQLVRNCAIAASRYTVENMAKRFLDGVISALDA